ncbi:hypothetical protein RSOLAG22IIIB_09261 [Rhizoctonia solani]|uniref:Uncharacterized protein n=1 Tax=Rhizoctonia solani TaxID=456999 RepID=A0A0K6FY00_9AGAM|nr:hypothetical protein RSOLAG22IIIB_09261 [Rhizoctonia solani]
MNKDTLATAAKYAAIASLVVTAGALVAPPLLGFTASGVAAGSIAAAIQSALYGGAVPAGTLFAFLQSIGATGVLIPAITAGLSAGVCCGFSRIVVDVLVHAYQAASADMKKRLTDLVRALMLMGALTALDWRRIAGGRGGVLEG